MVRVRSISADEFESPGRLLQTRFWASLKSQFGWRPQFFQLSRPPESSHVMVLSRKLAPGIELAYIPDGPPLMDGIECASQYLRSACSGIAPRLDPATACIRTDLHWPRDAVRPVDRLRKSFVDVQPPDSTEVDLAPSPESIFASFKSRSRRNIRKAARKGVSVQASEDIDLWYDLYRTTAERDRIAIHSREYYRSVFVTARNDPSVQVELLLAFYETTPLAGIVVAYTGKQAVYLYGASSNEHRETMPAYALQWEAIKRARERGCHVYDLFGIPPSEDPSHPMHGLYQFKVGFGGRIVHRAGCWDYPTKPAAYFIYREAERVRDFYYKTLKKRR